MASLTELAEQAGHRQADSAQQALQAIETITGVGNWWLTALTIFLGALALIGFAAVYAGARWHARQVADSRIKSYLDGDEAALLMRQTVSSEVVSQLEKLTFKDLMPKSLQPQQSDDSGFPKDPKEQA